MIESLPLHHLSRVVSLLSRGHLVAYPTGTSYALGVNVLNQAAVRRLAELKQRGGEKAYSLLLPRGNPERFVAWTAVEQRVLAALQTRPFTLLVRAAPVLAHAAKDGLVGIRTADHPFTRALTEMLPFPVTATSANVRGDLPACGLDELEALARGDVRLYAVEGGRLPRCVPSTVARLAGGRWHMLRAGEVTARELADTVAADERAVQAPSRAGQHKRKAVARPLENAR